MGGMGGAPEAGGQGARSAARRAQHTPAAAPTLQAGTVLPVSLQRPYQRLITAPQALGQGPGGPEPGDPVLQHIPGRTVARRIRRDLACHPGSGQ